MNLRKEGAEGWRVGGGVREKAAGTLRLYYSASVDYLINIKATFFLCSALVQISPQIQGDKTTPFCQT